MGMTNEVESISTIFGAMFGALLATSFH